MKYKTAIVYQLKKQLIFLAIFFAWWIVLGVIFPSIGVLVGGSDEVVSTDILAPMMGFSVIISFIATNTNFNFFIQNGLRRINIFLVNLLTMLLTSVCMAIAVYLFVKIPLSRLQFTAFLLSKNIYYSEHMLVNILLLFVVLFFLSAIGLLLGTFNDMFKGIKKIIILLIVMSVPIIGSIIIQLSGTAVQRGSLRLLGRLIGFSSVNGFVAAPFIVTFLVCAAICLVLFFFLNQHHEVSRKGE